MHEIIRSERTGTKGGPWAPSAARGAVLLLVLWGLWWIATSTADAGVHTHAPTPLVKTAVAFAIRREGADEWLTVTRPSDDKYLPNAVGLPAGYVDDEESTVDAVVARGWEKLGVGLKVIRFLGRATTVRADYVLHMEEYEAAFEDPSSLPKVPQPGKRGTQYAAWEWRHADALRPAAAAGSLCSQIFLKAARQAGQRR